jgi:hypothetical protein
MAWGFVTDLSGSCVSGGDILTSWDMSVSKKDLCSIELFIFSVCVCVFVLVSPVGRDPQFRKQRWETCLGVRHTLSRRPGKVHTLSLLRDQLRGDLGSWRSVVIVDNDLRYCLILVHPHSDRHTLFKAIHMKGHFRVRFKVECVYPWSWILQWDIMFITQHRNLFQMTSN